MSRQFLAALLLLAARALASQPHPSPGMSPGDVVRTVVSALRENNSPVPNAGIFTTYQFASPKNRAVTGPYGNFLLIVKSGSFTVMLHNDSFEMGSLTITGGFAQQYVTLRRKGHADERFQFNLALYDGCWLVDGVSRVSP